MPDALIPTSASLTQGIRLSAVNVAGQPIFHKADFGGSIFGASKKRAAACGSSVRSLHPAHVAAWGTLACSRSIARAAVPRRPNCRAGGGCCQQVNKCFFRRPASRPGGSAGGLRGPSRTALQVRGGSGGSTMQRRGPVLKGWRGRAWITVGARRSTGRKPGRSGATWREPGSAGGVTPDRRPLGQRRRRAAHRLPPAGLAWGMSMRELVYGREVDLLQ